MQRDARTRRLLEKFAVALAVAAFFYVLLFLLVHLNEVVNRSPPQGSLAEIRHPN